jgi:hypothetical protein
LLADPQTKHNPLKTTRSPQPLKFESVATTA